MNIFILSIIGRYYFKGKNAGYLWIKMYKY